MPLFLSSYFTCATCSDSSGTKFTSWQQTTRCHHYQLYTCPAKHFVTYTCALCWWKVQTYCCIRWDPLWGRYSMSLQPTFCAWQRICCRRSLELFFSRVLQGYEADAFLWCAHSFTFDAWSLSVCMISSCWASGSRGNAPESVYLQPYSDMMRWQENH